MHDLKIIRDDPAAFDAGLRRRGLPAQSADILALDAKDLPRRAYNVSGGSSHSLAEVAEIVAGIVPGVSVTFGDDPVGREYAIGRVDESIAARELGYRPKVTLAAGIADYAEWLKALTR